MKYALSSKISIIPSYNDFDPKLNPFYIHFRAQIAKFAPQNRYRKNNKIRTTFFDVLGSILAPLDPQKSSKKIEKNDPWRLLGLLALLGVPKGPFWGPFGLFWGCPGGPFGVLLACFGGVLGFHFWGHVWPVLRVFWGCVLESCSYCRRRREPLWEPNFADRTLDD